MVSLIIISVVALVVVEKVSKDRESKFKYGYKAKDFEQLKRR